MQNNGNNIKARLAQFLDHNGVGQAKFAEIVGVSKAFANNVGDSIRTDNLHKISAAYPELDTLWLLTGHGKMLKGGAAKVETQQGGDSVTIPREVFEQISKLTDAVMSQQRTIDSQQGNFTKLTDAVVAQQQTIAELVKKRQYVGGSLRAANSVVEEDE